MTTQLEQAARLALEAFEEAVDYVNDEASSPSMERECRKAITALRAALEQPAQEWNGGVPPLYPQVESGVSIKAESEQPAQCPGCEGKPLPENNPCAVCGKPAQQWTDETAKVPDHVWGAPPFRFRRFVYGQERAQDVVIERQDTLEKAIKKAAQICPKAEMTVLVYEGRPQAREPLTDEQRSWIVATCVTPRQIIDLVEKMHGIKGEA